jgi:hypothetical protein
MKILRPKNKEGGCTQQKKRKLNPSSQLPIALLNIENQEDKCTELQEAVDSLQTMPLIIGINESWERTQRDGGYRLKTHTWFGQPRGDGRGGIGFWVHNSIIHRVALSTTTNTNNAIMWIRFVGDKSTIHLAVVYSRPNYPAEHNTILRTLTANIAELETTGAITIMGDVNSKLWHLMHKDIEPYPASSYEKATWSFIKQNRLHIPINKTQIKENQHYTFIRDEAHSVLEYFMTCGRARASNYAVHPKSM